MPDDLIPVPARPDRGILLDPMIVIQALEASGDYLVHHRLRQPVVNPDHVPVFDEHVALIVDVETTGSRPDKEEVIELAMVAVIYNDQGQVGPVVGILHQLREPSACISALTTQLTGLSFTDVAGHRFDLDAIGAMVETAELIVAHNAGFDRPFLERIHPGFVHKPWACSVKEVPWGDFGYHGSRLSYLLSEHRLFFRAHRALQDCLGLLAVLSVERPRAPGSAFAALLASSTRDRVQVFVPLARYGHKDVLKQRGYRWSSGEDGRMRAWWIELDTEAVPAELAWLQDGIYLGSDDEPICRVLTAFDRYRAS